MNQSIIDHMLKKPAGRRDGHEAYFPLISKTVKIPAEIWVDFSISQTTRQVRHHYVRA